ncbi:MAG: uracil-DNA glycosylase [Verrucomicrobia bacterium]|nr:uracil-DNA glycosylase [Verrucomicrobiota bacterium]
MSSFTTALDAVLGHLEVTRLHGRTLKASRSALAALRASTETVPTLAAPPAPPPVAASAPSAVAPVALVPPAPVQVAPAPKPSEPKPASAPAVPLSKAERLAAMRSRTASCVLCPHLAESRKSVVFGVGDPDARLMFVGEAPGADEDVQGEPFVGRAGQLLTKIIQTMGFARDEVYIANILKCRPDTPGQSYGNRAPTNEEMQTCLPYLEEQIDIIRPEVLVALGGTAVRGLLGGEPKITSVRGRWHDFRGIPLMPTFHPSFLLRPENESKKRLTWEDMLSVKERLGLEITERERRYFLPKAAPAGE